MRPHTLSVAAIMTIVSATCLSAGTIVADNETVAPVPAAGDFHRWWLAGDLELFDEALALAGLAREEFNFPPDEVALWGGDKYRLPLFDLYFRDVWSISPFTHRASSLILESVLPPSRLAAAAQTHTGFRVRDNYYGSYITRTRDRVADEGAMALAHALELLGAGDAAAIAQAKGYAHVPPPVARAAAAILYQVEQAMRFREIALTTPIERLGLDPAEVWSRMFAAPFWEGAIDDEAPLNPADDLRELLEIERLLDAVDFATLYRGMNTILLGVDFAHDEFRGENARAAAVEELRAAAPKDESGAVIDEDALQERVNAVAASDMRAELAGAHFSFEIRTRLGWVRLNGTGTNVYGEDAAQHDLLIIDTGGDDRYHQAGNTPGYDRPVGIAVDLSGDDVYRSHDYPEWEAYTMAVRGSDPEFKHHRPADHAPAFGAGVCGYGILIDYGGDDVYEAPFVSQGAGVLGMGMLIDFDGDDRYAGDTGVQGSGTFGAGVLADLDGDDEYLCFFKAQGYGYTLGVGLLVDAAGNDRYIAAHDDPGGDAGDLTNSAKYAWFKGYRNALNMAQGFGYGRRADMSDGHSWAGGVGMLIDGGDGNDVYKGDIFCQGSAYWYALGILYDQGGNDLFQSHAYSLASPPHFAVGVVISNAGDDVYRGHGSRACGFGRDFSIGWFEDGSGNDRYYVNDSALGVGNVNGLGVFWDKAGDDIYVARANSFGQPFVEGEAGTWRDIIINAGLFIDAGGNDRYFRLPDELADVRYEPFDWGEGSYEGRAFEPLNLDYRGRGTSMRNGARISWFGVFDDRPASTGAAIDAR